jgi:rhodanese-related sulfurtransferase
MLICSMETKHLFSFLTQSMVAVLLLSFGSCSSSAAQSAEIKRISNQELQELLQNPEVQLVDVRTPNEYNQAHLANAQLIDFMKPDFSEKVDQLDKSKPIIVYCAVGGRSMQSTRVLKDLGFTEIYDLQKGIRGWLIEGLPVTK